jgi:hypothetical protein
MTTFTDALETWFLCASLAGFLVAIIPYPGE